MAAFKTVLVSLRSSVVYIILFEKGGTILKILRLMMQIQNRYFAIVLFTRKLIFCSFSIDFFQIIIINTYCFPNIN